MDDDFVDSLSKYRKVSTRWRRLCRCSRMYLTRSPYPSQVRRLVNPRPPPRAEEQAASLHVSPRGSLAKAPSADAQLAFAGNFPRSCSLRCRPCRKASSPTLPQCVKSRSPRPTTRAYPSLPVLSSGSPCSSFTSTTSSLPAIQTRTFSRRTFRTTQATSTSARASE